MYSISWQMIIAFIIEAENLESGRTVCGYLSYVIRRRNCVIHDHVIVVPVCSDVIFSPDQRIITKESLNGFLFELFSL